MIGLIGAFVAGFTIALALVYFKLLKGFQRYQSKAREKLKGYARQIRIAKMQLQQFEAMCHELLTPLHGISGMAENLESTNLNDEQKEMVGVIGKTSNQLFNVFKGVMHFHDNQRTVPENERKSTQEMTSLTGIPILIVEDNPVNQKLAASYLKKVGVEADIAGNGLEAIDQVKLKNYAIIFMDISMPEMDGFEASRKIRELPDIPKDTVIVAFTANSSKEYLDQCMEAGMNDYITKPASSADILAVTYKWLEKTRGIPAPQATAAPVQPVIQQPVAPVSTQTQTAPVPPQHQAPPVQSSVVQEQPNPVPSPAHVLQTMQQAFATQNWVQVGACLMPLSTICQTHNLAETHNLVVQLSQHLQAQNYQAAMSIAFQIQTQLNSLVQQGAPQNSPAA